MTDADNLRRHAKYDGNGYQKLSNYSWLKRINSTDTRLVKTVHLFDRNDRMERTIDRQGNMSPKE